MNKCFFLWNIICESIFEYETSKVVQIRSWKIGFVYRLIQLAIILYVTLWVMYAEKGYQIFDYPVSGVTAKLKGIAFANLTNVSSIGMRVWDTADFVIPPQQNSAFFVATNMVITPNQSLGFCDESIDVYGVTCKNDSQCLQGKHIHVGSGVETGKCVESTKLGGVKVCQIYGWCPTEDDSMPLINQSLLKSAPNFTVLLKNSIEFTTFKIKRRNILSWMTKEFLYSCRYNPYDRKLKYCPIFRLADIVRYSDAQNKNIWIHGGLMSIHIEWNCDLDFNVEHCVPEYTFRRLDDFKEDVGKGWNFRYSYHYMENSIEKRTLIKVYGIQFFITVSGRGGKFNPFKFSMNLGSGLALLGIASVLCDLLILNIVRKRDLYKRARVDSFKSALRHRIFVDGKESCCGNNITDKYDKSTKRNIKTNRSRQEYHKSNVSPKEIVKDKVRIPNTAKKVIGKTLTDNFQLKTLMKKKVALSSPYKEVNSHRTTSFRHSHSFDCLIIIQPVKAFERSPDNEYIPISKSTEVAWIDDCAKSDL